jgi:DNA-binding Lrp family transcriptional regulator
MDKWHRWTTSTAESWLRSAPTGGSRYARSLRLCISPGPTCTPVSRGSQRDGVITGYTATIDRQRYGYALSAYVYLKVTQQSWQTLRNRVASIPEVEYCALVSGENDIVLLVRTTDTRALRDLVLTRLQSMPEVRTTHTVLIFDQVAPGYPVFVTRCADGRAGGDGSDRIPAPTTAPGAAIKPGTIELSGLMLT